MVTARPNWDGPLSPGGEHFTHPSKNVVLLIVHRQKFKAMA
jgi:hypothetical protein